LPVYAERAGLLGAGLLLGDPTAGSLKYFVNEKEAVDFGVGVSDELTLIGDYLWHGWNLLPQPTHGPLGFYFSLGGRLEFQDKTDVGIRTMAGLSYWPQGKRPLKHPVEFFLELGPVLQVAPETRGHLDGGFGLRVYFSPRKS
jgi:hypothetical protein